jgi:hypothetical protein
LHFNWYVTAERIVVLTYLFSMICVLLGLLFGVLLLNSSGGQVFIVLTIPFSTLFFLPLFHIVVSPLPFWLTGLPSWGTRSWGSFLSWSSSPVPEPFWFFSVVGWLGLLLFYPVVSCLLWNRFRVGWALSLFAAVSTIGLSLYEALVEGLAEGWPPLPMTDWTFGVVANSIILFLLWRCKNVFFKPCRPSRARFVAD